MAESEEYVSDDYLAFKMAPVGIVMTKNRIIKSCNPEFAHMFGFEPEALIDQSFAILYPSFEEFVQVRDVGVERLSTTGLYSDERIMARSDGSRFWCRVRGRTLVTSGDPLAHAVWSFSDLSRDRPVTELSTRERQIVMHLIDGKTSKEIAAILSISPRTVETYRAKMLKKFDACNVVELLQKLGSVPV